MYTCLPDLNELKKFNSEIVNIYLRIIMTFEVFSCAILLYGAIDF